MKSSWGVVKSYQADENMVLVGVGKFFRYEFVASKANIPAFAAVSPNRETGAGLSV